MLKDSRIKTMVILAIVCIIPLVLFCATGVLPKNLEKDIRKSQKISEEWIVEGNYTDDMAAFISYPLDQSSHVFSVYLNRSGLSFGYFFRGGGSLWAVEEGIAEFRFLKNNGVAYISMNAHNVERLEIDNGHDIKVIEIHSNKPFAIVVSNQDGEVRFYDVNGNVVDYYRERF